VTRPDIVTGIHDAYLEAGADCVTTNSFGANLGNLGEYGIAERIAELSEASARLARAAADRWATAARPRWVLGSIGPGTKLPTLGHTTFRELRDTYQVNAEALLRGGADALIIETCQDLLQLKAAVLGARRAMAQAGRRIPVIAHVTMETTGTMLLGSEIGAALTAVEPLGVDMIGLNCATGPAEMSEHLRYLSKHARVPISVMPNAGHGINLEDPGVFNRHLSDFFQTVDAGRWPTRDRRAMTGAVLGRCEDRRCRRRLPLPGGGRGMG